MKSCIHRISILVLVLIIAGCSDNPTKPTPSQFIGYWHGQWMPRPISGLPFYTVDFGFVISEGGIGTGTATATISADTVTYDSQWSDFDISVDKDGTISGEGALNFYNSNGDVLAQSPVMIHGSLTGPWKKDGSLGSGSFDFIYEDIYWSAWWIVVPDSPPN